jgi:hypothetical protein
MLLFAAGLLAQSFLNLVRDTHEVLLHADAGETYTHQLLAHQHHEPADQDPGADSSGLHGLLHQSCGGHCIFLSGTFVQPALVRFEAAVSPEGSARRVPASDYTTPFRPPIRA